MLKSIWSPSHGSIQGGSSIPRGEYKSSRSISSGNKENGPRRCFVFSLFAFASDLYRDAGFVALVLCMCISLARMYADIYVGRRWYTCDYFMSSLEKLDAKSKTGIHRWFADCWLVVSVAQLEGWLRSNFTKL